MAAPKITICMGSSCFARGNERNLEFAERWLAAHGFEDGRDCELGGELCTGNCASGPVVCVDGKIHTCVDENVMEKILEETFAGRIAK